jgi:TP901 family phage tail tape measure protein
MPGMYKYSMEIESNVKKLLLDTKELQDKMDTLEGKEYKINLNIDEKKLGNVISNLEKMLDSLGKGTGDFKQFENLSKELSSIVSEVQSLSKAFGKVDDSGTKTLLSSIQNIDKSLSELSQNILNVNKNMSNMGGDTSGAVKQVENISDAYQNAAKEAVKLADAQSKIGQKTNISSEKKDAFPDKDISASVDSATNSIKEENNVLEQNTQKVKENTQAKEQNANVNFNKYDKRLDSYNGKIDKYKTTIDRFNDGGWTSDEYLKNVQAVKDAVKEYETLLNELKGKDASLVTSDDINRLDNYEKKIKDTIATVTNMSAAEKGYNFVSGQKELDKIHKLLNENSKMSSEAKAKIRAYYTEIESGNPSMSLDRIHGEIMKIYNAEVEAGRAGRSFFDTLKNSGFHQLAAQMSGMFGFYDVINLIKQAASAVTELNTQITELAKVSEDSVSQIYADFDSYANIAKEMGSTISDTIAATTAWSKNGYNIPDSKELAEVSLLYKNVGDGINIDEANESLVSTLKGFKLEADQAEHIVDVFNEVSNREPISSSGIGEALQRSAASFNAANTSLEKSVALVTATNSVLQDPEKVGNMWKTVSARIRGAKTELEEAGEDTDGMVESTSKLQALIKGMTGFDIMKSDGKTFKDIYDIIIGIGEKWQDLNDVDRASLLEKLAGKNQINALAAAISQVDVLKKAYGEATNAEGSAREENSKYQQSVQYSIDQTKAKLEELANDTLNSKFLKGLINAGGKIIDILDIIIKNVGILKPLLAGLAIKNIVQNFD